MEKLTVLVTGGLGYIGSHTAVELIQAGYRPVILDNLSNSREEVLDQIEKITETRPKLYIKDLVDFGDVMRVFEKENVEAVIHFAALKAVGESVSMPLEYYFNNMVGALNLLKAMKEFNVNKFVFSSSATVYGNPATNPILEDFPLSATNPYGSTKLMIEDVLRDTCEADSNLNVAILRYFNPIGAHKSGLIGEMPTGTPNNLMPYITKVATGELEYLEVFGADYDTHDGTGIRDYIHVVDLSDGHLKALEKLKTDPGLVTYNLGTGRGYSVLELVENFKKTTGVNIQYKIGKRRPGDATTCYANSDLAKRDLGWEAKYDIGEMCEDSWRWEQNSVMLDK